MQFFCSCPLQVEREKAALMTSLQETQTQLQHTEGALSEQHEKVLHLSQKVRALRRLHRRARLHQEAHSAATSPSNPEAPMELDRDEEDHEEEEYEGETLNKSQVFSYQTPGLEILQCKYRVAVTEVVELKAELKVLRERLAHCGEGGAELKPRRNTELQRLERQVVSLEKSCRESREKVTTAK